MLENLSKINNKTIDKTLKKYENIIKDDKIENANSYYKRRKSISVFWKQD